MAWAKKLRGLFRLTGREMPNVAAFEGGAGAARVLSTLLENPSVGGKQKIGQALQEAGQRVDFRKGEDLIVQGQSDDDVYFLLFGEVEIRIDSGYRQVRAAPTQVGEMAALDSGAARSATVRAKSETVVAWKVPAQDYRRIMETDKVALGKVQREVRDRQRQLIGWRPGKGKWENLGYWTVIALIVAGFGAGVAWIVLGLGAPDMGGLERALITGLISVVLFIYTMTHNPAFFFRRMIVMIIGIIALPFLLDWTLSTSVKQGDSVTEFAIETNGLDLDWSIGLSIFVPLLVLASLLAYLEHKRQSN